jgi:ATP-dependent exoDNAse (exonuclease V) beta subunit
LADAHFLKNERGKILKTADEILLWDFSENYRPPKVEQLRLDQNESDDGELYRLLYVAMTRAEDFLYILGEKHQNQLNSKCWYSFLKQFSE